MARRRAGNGRTCPPQDTGRLRSSLPPLDIERVTVRVTSQMITGPRRTAPCLTCNGTRWVGVEGRRFPCYNCRPREFLTSVQHLSEDKFDACGNPIP